MAAYVLAFIWVGFGLWTKNLTWVAVGGGLSLLFLLYALRFHRFSRIKPSGLFLWWAGFQLVLVVSSIWHQTPESTHLALLTSIGLIWYYFGSIFSENKIVITFVVKSWILAGFGLSGLWLLSHFFRWDIFTFGAESLVVHASFFKNHNHIGDFVILPLLALLLKRHVSVVFLLLVLVLSISRSALVGLMIGLFYLIFNYEAVKWHWKRLLLMVGFIGVVFMAFSLYKPPVSARSYLVQSVAGLTTHPFGVGFGNFSKVSANVANHWYGMSDYSQYTHSFPFEWITGIGVVGLVGFGLLLIHGYDLGLKTKKSEKALVRAGWWAMTAVLMFDSAYVVPSYYWLWMLLMGLAR